MGVTVERDLSVTFGSVALSVIQCPKKLPYPMPKSIVRKYQMSNGSDGAGLRALYLGGVDYSNTDLNIRFDALTKTQIDLFVSDYFDQRTIKTFTVIDNNGPTTIQYKFLYQEDGLTPELVAGADYSEDGNFWRVNCRIHILERTL